MQDAWRARKDLTISMGVRWEVQFPFVALNNRFAVTSYEGLFGVSGAGNCSSRERQTGKPTEFVQLPIGQHASRRSGELRAQFRHRVEPECGLELPAFILGTRGEA